LLLNARLYGGSDPWNLDNSTEVVLKRARRWWSRNDDGPRFLFINLIDPHRPYRPAPSDLKAIGVDVDSVFAQTISQDPADYFLDPGMSQDERRILNALYDGEIRGMDRELGPFFDWLDRRGELDRTLLVVTSDHGERLGERGWVGHDLVMDQYLLRVPLIVRFPESISPSRWAGPVRLDGLPGHILYLCGIDPPDEMARRSLDGLTPGVLVAQYQYPGWFLERLRKRGFDEAPYRGDWLFVTDGRYAYSGSSDGTIEPVLVDLSDDPGWTTNLADIEPGTLRRLRDAAESLPRFEDAPRSRVLDPASRERLKTLGYLD
jgi:arylsulfatase A-like enzyme